MAKVTQRASVVASLVAAAIAGYLIGAVSAPAAPAPEPTVAIAAIPTSTPDLRTPLPTATPTPTSPPAPLAAVSAAPTAAAPEPTAIPETFAPLRPTPTPIPTRFPRGSPVVYVARPGDAPLPVAVTDDAGGGTASDRIYRRLRALPRIPAPDGSVNLAARSGSTVMGVTVVGDGRVILEYALLGGTWGPASQDDLRLLMQQIVFTATEEAGVDLVSLRRYGGGPVPVRPGEEWTFTTQMSRESLLASP